jgi:hypothetical protein
MVMPLGNYATLYHQLSPAPQSLTNILVDYSQVAAGDSVPADDFFQKYGMGNVINGIDRPYERMKGYEFLLDALRNHDATHFEAIHKGTPYYFLGWTAFQVEDYARATFYLDAGVSEDIRLIGRNETFDITNPLHQTPAVKFLLLDQNAGHVGAGTAAELNRAVEDELSIFSAATTRAINLQRFIDEFVLDNTRFLDPGFRTILTSFYSFIREFDNRYIELQLRSSEGGSIEPFLTHLFKGGLILESLLKFAPPGDTVGTLRPAITAHNGDLGLDMTLIGGRTTLDQVVVKMSELEANGTDYHNRCYAIAYALRNTAGHKLHWPDVFTTDVYLRLYRCEVGAILWTISSIWNLR